MNPDFAGSPGSLLPHYALFVIPYLIQPELILADRRKPYVGLPIARFDPYDLLRSLHQAVDGIAKIKSPEDRERSQLSCDIIDEFDDEWNKEPGHFTMFAVKNVLAESRHNTGAFIRHHLDVGEHATIGRPDPTFTHFENWEKAGRPVLAHV